MDSSLNTVTVEFASGETVDVLYTAREVSGERVVAERVDHVADSAFLGIVDVELEADRIASISSEHADRVERTGPHLSGTFDVHYAGAPPPWERAWRRSRSRSPDHSTPAAGELDVSTAFGEPDATEGELVFTLPRRSP